MRVLISLFNETETVHDFSLDPKYDFHLKITVFFQLLNLQCALSTGIYSISCFHITDREFV